VQSERPGDKKHREEKMNRPTVDDSVPIKGEQTVKVIQEMNDLAPEEDHQ